jgi:hypothetical protein
MKVYKTKIVEEDGEIAFEFPDELMESFNLTVGDTFEWLSHDGYVILKKVGNEDSSS